MACMALAAVTWLNEAWLLRCYMLSSMWVRCNLCCRSQVEWTSPLRACGLLDGGCPVEDMAAIACYGC